MSATINHLPEITSFDEFINNMNFEKDDIISPIECPICYDSIIENKNCVVTECGHTFHCSCLMKNSSHNGFSCPMCRTLMVETNSTNVIQEDDDDDDDSVYDSEDDSTYEYDIDSRADNLSYGFRLFERRVNDNSEFPNQENDDRDTDIDDDNESSRYQYERRRETSENTGEIKELIIHDFEDLMDNIYYYTQFQTSHGIENYLVMLMLSFTKNDNLLCDFDRFMVNKHSEKITKLFEIYKRTIFLREHFNNYTQKMTLRKEQQLFANQDMNVNKC
jgi:hypothetical protein